MSRTPTPAPFSIPRLRLKDTKTLFDVEAGVTLSVKPVTSTKLGLLVTNASVLVADTTCKIAPLANSVEESAVATH